MEIWRRGVARHRQPYPALLILEHALRLHAEQRGHPDWLDFFTDLERDRDQLSAQSGISTLEIRDGYRWLELADALSLLACRRQDRRIVHGGLRAGLAGHDLALDPFPLAGATTFAIPCRRVPDHPYSGDAEYGLALANAKWETTQIRVVPGAPAGP